MKAIYSQGMTSDEIRESSFGGMPPHKRHDKGVIIMWELHMKGNIFVVEQFRGSMHCSSCFRRSCEHAKVAEQLEQNYQISNQGEKPGSCFFCGRPSPERNGLAVCATCAK